MIEEKQRWVSKTTDRQQLYNAQLMTIKSLGKPSGSHNTNPGALSQRLIRSVKWNWLSIVVMSLISKRGSIPSKT
jgi:hypothetical protein